MTNLTPQEKFWSGQFGDDYVERNDLSPEIKAIYLNRWSKIIPLLAGKMDSVLELGPNIGRNLRALKELMPSAKLSGVEINSKAAKILKQWGQAEVYQKSFLSFEPSKNFDLVFTSGVLIHVGPDSLPQLYNKIYSLSRRYIVFIEYFNPEPIEVTYRNNSGVLFKRDFAGDLMNIFLI